MSDEETIDFIVCSKCPLPETLTVEELHRRELIYETVGDETHGMCPICREVIFIRYDYGTIDFGIDPSNL